MKGIRTNVRDRYHVEVNEGRGWIHVHPPTWETTLNLTVAADYAAQVRRDYPGAQVEIVGTTIVTVWHACTNEREDIIAARATVRDGQAYTA